MTSEQLAETICVCTENHDPGRRIECAYAVAAAEKVTAAGWEPPGRRLDLLRAVLSYVDSHAEADLPLTLLEEIRSETARLTPPGATP